MRRWSKPKGGDLEDLYRPVNVAPCGGNPCSGNGCHFSSSSYGFGLYAMRLGAGRAVKSDDLDYETGIVFEKKVGDSVQREKLLQKYTQMEKFLLS